MWAKYMKNSQKEIQTVCNRTTQLQGAAFTLNSIRRDARCDGLSERTLSLSHKRNAN